MEYVPGEAMSTCVIEVLALLHTKATGATPPLDDAVHVMLAVLGTPTHETDNAVLAKAAGAAHREARRDTIAMRYFILYAI